MKQLITTKTNAAVLALALVAMPTWAASSGNFSARVATTQCEINGTTGSLSGGLTNTLLSTTIQTPNSGSTALVIRPSLVTGLFTKTRVSDTTSATAIAGIKVRVLIDGKVVAPGIPVGAVAGPNDGWIFFDKRFQQLNSNVTTFLGTTCDDPLTVGVIEPCYIELILSTLNANSFDFVVGDVGGGDHTLTAEWKFELTSAAPADATACVGPGVLTVQQVKTFSTGGGIVITPDN